MVEIGESSFTYLQIFYSLDYGIPLLSYKIVCWVLALIFHIGCHIKDFKSTILNISQKMSSSDIYDLPKYLGTSLLLLLQLFFLTHKFKVTQALLASKVYVCSHLGDKVIY